jgi:rhamnogalacturonan endolyase
MEYMSGGPTKVEFLCHRDTNPIAAPTVLNYWRSSHYGGADVSIDSAEVWEKVVGPFLIYACSGLSPETMYSDAKKQAITEAGKWPYDWVSNVGYPLPDERAAVKGTFALNDPLVKGEFANLMVGLTAPEYKAPRPPEGMQAPVINWQRDAKFYQFWTKGDADGTFEIDKVRPGHYSLYAFTDGILGEFVKTNIVIEEGQTLDLGKLTWTPKRNGKQLWDVGIPNRNASEFFMAGNYNDLDISLVYAKLFPDDIKYVIGESDFTKDWFFQHVPHNENPEARPMPYFGTRDPGRATPYTIIFNLSSDPSGKGILRVAICGTGARSLEVKVNGTDVGSIDDLIRDGTIARHGMQGIWYERELRFDARLMHRGENTLVLTVPEGPVNNGIMYDYIRLELNEDQGID